MLSVSVISDVAPGTGSITSTENTSVPVPVPPEASAPTVFVQTEPALLSGTQDHPAAELPGLNTVLAGTAAVSFTPEAPWLPVLA